MEHLACYFPGNLAQGVHEGAVVGAKAARYLDAARNLTATCWHLYAKQPTGEARARPASGGAPGSARAQVSVTVTLAGQGRALSVPTPASQLRSQPMCSSRCWAPCTTLASSLRQVHAARRALHKPRQRSACCPPGGDATRLQLGGDEPGLAAAVPTGTARAPGMLGMRHAAAQASRLRWSSSTAT